MMSPLQGTAESLPAARPSEREMVVVIPRSRGVWVFRPPDYRPVLVCRHQLEMICCRLLLQSDAAPSRVAENAPPSLVEDRKWRPGPQCWIPWKHGIG